MARNLMGTSLRARKVREREDVDPMSSVANLADVMLVFACGLMMALVAMSGISLGTNQYAEVDGQQMEQIDNPDTLPEDMTEQGSSYVEAGTVYQDPRTGKYYMLSQDKGSMDEGLSSDGSEGDSNTDSNAGSGDTGSSSGADSGSAASGSSAVAAPDRSAGAD